MIILTQVSTGKRIALRPTHFILHQPRKTQIMIGKPAFRFTTLMSVLSPSLMEQVSEDYDIVKREITRESKKFVELTHGETGTKFLISPDFFELQEPGCTVFSFNETSKYPTLVSLWNPALHVPIKENFERACELLSAKTVLHA